MVYFIKSDSGHVKIGFTERHFKYRLADLQVGNPYMLSVIKELDWDRYQEMKLHNKFSRHRVIGEWFNLHEDILSFLQNPP